MNRTESCFGAASRVAGLCFLVALSACNCGKQKLLFECGLAAIPSTLNFDSVSVGVTATQGLTIRNTGSEPLTICNAEFGVADDSFTLQGLTGCAATDVTSGCPSGSAGCTIDEGGEVTATIAFSPATSGNHMATLDFSTDGCDDPDGGVAVITGVGDQFGVVASPSQLSFGCEAVAGQSTTQTITLTNDSNPPEEEIVTVSRSGASDFQLSGSNLSFDLAPDASVPLPVSFSPTSLGGKQETLQITACGIDGGGCTVPVSYVLEGDGAGTTLVAAPAAVNFPNLPAGLGASQVVTISAVSLSDAGGCALPATVSQPTLLHGNAGFALVFDAGFPVTLTPLGAESSFSLLVDFTSIVDGGQSDVAVVTFSVGGSAQPDLDIPLNGNPVEGPCFLTPTPASVSFGTTYTGQSDIQPVQVCNSGGDVCEISSIAITKNDAQGEFSVSDAGVLAPQALAPGQCATIEVAFNATSSSSPSARNGTLTLTTNDLTDGGVGLNELPLFATEQAPAFIGQVLVAGGQAASNTVLSSAEVYNMATDSWSLTGSMTTPRQFHQGVFLSTGRALVAGGTNSTGNLASSELFIPQPDGGGYWRPTMGNGGAMDYAPGSFPGFGRLPSGKVLVAGGVTSSFLSTADLFDPTSESWSLTGSLPNGVNNFPFALLPTGELLIGGGALQCCFQTDTLVSVLYESTGPNAGTWVPTTGQLPQGLIWNEAVALTSGDALIIGGMNTGGTCLSDTELYNHTAGTWSAGTPMNFARCESSAIVLPSGDVLVAGGGSSPSTPSNTAEIYNPDAGTWTQTGNLTMPRVQAPMNLLPNGQALVIGGLSTGSTPTASCELYNPDAGTWRVAGSLATPRVLHAAISLQ